MKTITEFWFAKEGKQTYISDCSYNARANYNEDFRSWCKETLRLSMVVRGISKAVEVHGLSLPKIAQDNKIPGCFHSNICEITGAFDKLQHQSKVWEYFLKFSKVLGRPRALPTTQFNVYLKAVNSLFVRSIN